jgi:hypothetical protein
MSLSTTSVVDDADNVEPLAEPARPPREHRVLPVLVMLGAVAVAAGLPLIRNHIFYFWDDTAGAGVPVWHRMAGEILHGRFPLLNLDMWRGGNFAAEAATGMWNPVTVVIAIGIYFIDNMAVGIAIAKTLFMMIMAGGAYLLARHYGIRRSLAAVIGAALPLAGYSFFMDSTAWVNALMATAFVPWVWWAGRLAIRDGRSVLWLVIAGYLGCSLGNPYGLVSTGLVILALMVEAWFNGQRGRIIPVALAGVAVALMNVMVYLPLLLTSSVGYRAASGTFNDNFLKPSLTNLLELSTPSTQPYLIDFSIGNFSVPVAYLAWFILPTLPWLRWRVLVERWRPLMGVYVFGAVYLMLMLGPSQIWLFRWPLRLIDFLWFPVILIWAVLANAGMQRTKWRERTIVSVLIVFAGA